MRTVAIAGVGLIGGSFALALRKAGFDGTIVGVSSPRTINEALSLGIIDEGAALADALPRADLVFLAQPIARILELLGEIDPLLKAGALVTDAGSTKAAIVAAAQHIRRAQFLGGHPMAGKETRGVAAADADLFAGRSWVLTPRHPEEIESEAARDFRQWVARTGALPLVMDPAEHDRVVALTSHLPQLASTALASVLAGTLHLPSEAGAAGPALLDSTRLALSSFDIWRDILATNTANISQALGLYIETLQKIQSGLNGPAMKAEFERAAAFAIALRRDKI
jgi:prephenate dehydrogenase